MLMTLKTDGGGDPMMIRHSFTMEHPWSKAPRSSWPICCLGVTVYGHKWAIASRMLVQFVIGSILSTQSPESWPNTIFGPRSYIGSTLSFFFPWCNDFSFWGLLRGFNKTKDIKKKRADIEGQTLIMSRYLVARIALLLSISVLF